MFQVANGNPYLKPFFTGYPSDAGFAPDVDSIAFICFYHNVIKSGVLHPPRKMKCLCGGKVEATDKSIEIYSSQHEIRLPKYLPIGKVLQHTDFLLFCLRTRVH